MDHAIRLFKHRSVWLAAAAVASGGLLSALPLPVAGAMVVGLLGGAAAVLGPPALALGLAVALGPTRAWLAASGYGGLLYDLGQWCFGLALASWLWRGLIRRQVVIPPLPLLIPLTGLLGIGLVTLLGASDWPNGLLEAVKWAELLIAMIIAYDEARQGRVHWLLAAILLGGLAQAALGVWQFGLRGTGPASFELPGGHYRAYGTFEQPNPFGGFLGLIWPLPLGLALQPAPGRRIESAVKVIGGGLVTLVLLAGLGVSYSRGAWLGAGAALLAFLVFWPRRLSWGLGLAAAVALGGTGLAWAGLLPPSVIARFASVADFVNVIDVRGIQINDANFAIVERLAHWQAALEMIRAHPWFGVGLGNYIAAYPDYALINWPFHLGHAHNIYLHTWAETGLWGLLAYAAVWLTAISLTLREIRRSSGSRRGLALGLLGVWIHLLMHQVVDNLHVNNIDLLLGVELGLLEALPFLWESRHLGNSAGLDYNASTEKPALCSIHFP